MNAKPKASSRNRRIIIGVLVALLVGALGYLCYYEMYRAERHMVFREGDVTLYVDSEGFLVARFDAPEKLHPYTGRYSAFAMSAVDFSGGDLSNDRVVCTVQPTQSAWPRLFGAGSGTYSALLPLEDLRMVDGQLIHYMWQFDDSKPDDGAGEPPHSYVRQTVNELRFGGRSTNGSLYDIDVADSVTVYRAGDAIPYSPDADAAYRADEYSVRSEILAGEAAH